MFGKMMNSFYYGKSGKGDYRKEDLPKNRWQLFFEVLRVRLSGLVKVNLLYAVVWIPMIALLVMSLLAAMGLLTEMINEAGELVGDWAVFTDKLLSVVYTGLIFAIPCIAITGPFTAGIAYITRNWARDEHSFIWSDFKDTLKENWKQALVTSTITGVVPFLVYVGYVTYGQMIETMGLFFIVPQVLIIMLAIVWSMALIYIYPLMVSYKLSYGQLLRNALLLSIGRLPQTIGLRLLALLPIVLAVVILFFTNAFEIIMLVMVALYALFLLAFNHLAYASYSNGVFDKYINAHLEGVAVNRGLSEPEDDDEGDEIEE